MSRKCEIIADKGPMSGNNVSHAKNRTRRVFLPNIQRIRLFSEILSEKVRLDICAKAIRTIDFKGGLDQFLLKTSNRKLASAGLKLKKRILARQKKIAA